MKKRQSKETELGLEYLCPKCDDWWPEDFFHKKGKDARQSYCKACASEAVGRHYWLKKADAELLTSRERI